MRLKCIGLRSFSDTLFEPEKVCLWFKVLARLCIRLNEWEDNSEYIIIVVFLVCFKKAWRGVQLIDLCKKRCD